MNDFEFQFQSLNKIFSKLDEKAQMEFARSIKEGWNDQMKQVYQDTVRTFYKKLALESTDFDEVLRYRYALQMWQEFEKNILQFITFFDDKIKKITKQESIKNI